VASGVPPGNAVRRSGYDTTGAAITETAVHAVSSLDAANSLPDAGICLMLSQASSRCLISEASGLSAGQGVIKHPPVKSG